jgi:hypothetical protein
MAKFDFQFKNVLNRLKNVLIRLAEKQHKRHKQQMGIIKGINFFFFNFLIRKEQSFTFSKSGI